MNTRRPHGRELHVTVHLFSRWISAGDGVEDCSLFGLC